MTDMWVQTKAAGLRNNHGKKRCRATSEPANKTCSGTTKWPLNMRVYCTKQGDSVKVSLFLQVSFWKAPPWYLEGKKHSWVIQIGHSKRFRRFTVPWVDVSKIVLNQKVGLLADKWIYPTFFSLWWIHSLFLMFESPWKHCPCPRTNISLLSYNIMLVEPGSSLLANIAPPSFYLCYSSHDRIVPPTAGDKW